MEERKIKNKKGEILTTKEGVELTELRFEVGDEFIPLFNSVFEKTRTVNINGIEKNITNYSIKCRVKDKTGKTIEVDKNDEVFVTLTPAQAKSLTKKAESGVDLNQNLFIVYEYESKNYGKQIGVGLKSNKKAKSFEDLVDE